MSQNLVVEAVAPTPGRVIRRLVSPRRHGDIGVYNIRPLLWLLRAVSVLLLLFCVAILIQVSKAAPQAPRGGPALIGVFGVLVAIAMLFWSIRAGVHVTPEGIHSVTFSTKPAVIPWSEFDHFEYAPFNGRHRIDLVAPDGSRRPMRILTFWPYHANKLGRAYCAALNADAAPRAVTQRGTSAT
ncbi:MAG: hypothetical protein ACRDNK_17405 [Solirubrobacteraceae bacterium]